MLFRVAYLWLCASLPPPVPAAPPRVVQLHVFDNGHSCATHGCSKLSKAECVDAVKDGHILDPDLDPGSGNGTLAYFGEQSTLRWPPDCFARVTPESFGLTAAILQFNENSNSTKSCAPFRRCVCHCQFGLRGPPPLPPLAPSQPPSLPQPPELPPQPPELPPQPLPAAPPPAAPRFLQLFDSGSSCAAHGCSALKRAECSGLPQWTWYSKQHAKTFPPACSHSDAEEFMGIALPESFFFNAHQTPSNCSRERRCACYCPVSRPALPPPPLSLSPPEPPAPMAQDVARLGAKHLTGIDSSVLSGIVAAAAFTCLCASVLLMWARRQRRKSSQPSARASPVMTWSELGASSFTSSPTLNQTPGVTLEMTVAHSDANSPEAETASFEMTLVEGNEGSQVELEREIGRGGFASVWLARCQVR
jgi:hypothetical protein